MFRSLKTRILVLVCTVSVGGSRAGSDEQDGSDVLHFDLLCFDSWYRLDAVRNSAQSPLTIPRPRRGSPYSNASPEVNCRTV